MIINKITLKNFYRYGSKEQELDLTGSGITGIMGLNGNGKSTCIIDSLLFALFGKYRCDTIDGVVNRYIGKDCKVGIEFTEGGKNYKVIRYRAHTTHKNNVYIFEEDKDISGHTAAETNAKILDIIKMNYIAFTNSSVFSSELYSAFLANKVSERLVIFENILSLKEITAFYVECKSILKELNEKKEELNLQISSISAEINALTTTKNNYSNNARTKLLQMKADKENLKNKIDIEKAKIEELSIVDVEFEKSKLTNTKLKEEYLNRISLLEKEKSEIKNIDISGELLIVDKYKDVNFEEEKIKEEKYKEDLQTISSRENSAAVISSNITAAKEKLSNFNNSKLLWENEKIEILKKIENLKTSTCPFCGQHLTSDKAEAELKKSLSRQEELNTLIEDGQKESDLLKTQLEEDTEQYDWLLCDIRRIKEQLNNKFVSNADLVKEQYNNALNLIKIAEAEKIKQSEKISKINYDIEDLKSKINSLETTNYTEEELNNIANNINECKNNIEELNKEIAKIDGSVSSVYDKNYVDTIVKNISEKEEELKLIDISSLDDDIKHYSYLSECFSNKSGGFKKYFIGEMIDLFNNKINQYLPFFFSEKVEISFDKDLNEKILMDDFEVSFSSFSQGQRQRAELAINFALFDVARVFFSNDNKLLILDEMDKGLDKFGIKSMINLLKGFDSQLRIFIVSHNPLMEEEIDDKIKIERDENGFSIICQKN